MTATTLPADTRRVHRALLRHYIATGAIPSAQELAEAAQVSTETIPGHCHELAQAGYVHFDQVGQPTCLYPFSPNPTPHVLIIEGQRRYAMCAVDALGIAKMLDQRVTIESRCVTCGAPLRLVVRPDGIDGIEPSTMRVVIGRQENGAWNTACCGMTQFACSPDCAAQAARRLPTSEILPPPEALPAALELFGSMLSADTLPAQFLPDAR